MKKIILIIVLFVTNVFALSTAKVVEKAEPMTFRVVVPLGGSKASTGTGFIINKDGYLITNNHVVRGHRGKMFVKNKFDTYKNVILVKTYPKRDIAILKIENYTKGIFFKLQDPKTIKKGEMIFPLGYPGAADILEGLSFNASLSQGVISKIDHDTSGHFINNYTLIQIDAVINHGNSGGPLLNKNSSVVGINTLGNAKRGVQGIFWSIHIEELIKTLKENSIAYTIDDTSLVEKDKTENIWYALAIFGLIIVVVIFFIVKHKKAPAKADEREISRLVKEKIIKHTPENSHEVVEPALVDNIAPKNKTRIMSIALVSLNSSLPEINNMKKQEITLGRSTSCDVVIDSATVSKEHLKLVMQGSLVEVTDFGSTNGTYIDGQKLTPNKQYNLEVGQNLLVGGEDIIYSIKSSENKLEKSAILICTNNIYQDILKEGILGRSSDCDIVIANENISRKHLELEETDGKVFITDLGSANGTYIDGNKLEENEKTELCKGSKLVIGSEDVIYKLFDK